MQILISIIVLLSTGVLCALLLTVASVFFGVEDDERALKIREVLPGANCGACGYSGCDAYAKALSEGKEDKTNLCIPGGDGTASNIAEIMGVSAEDVIEQVAYVACNGLCLEERKKYDYDGPKTCKVARLNFSGDNECNFACLGYGDCMKVCPRDAICMNDKGIATVDPRKCIGCGMCVKECPNHIIYLLRDTARVVVTCNNHYKGAKVRQACKNGCIACGKCERTCPTGAIVVKDNLASIDYEKCIDCGACREVCPVKCIHEGNFFCGAHFE